MSSGLVLSTYMLTSLTLCNLCASSADEKLNQFFLFSPENRIWHSNLHEMSNPVFWENKNISKMPSADIFIQHAKFYLSFCLINLDSFFYTVVPYINC